MASGWDLGFRAPFCNGFDLEYMVIGLRQLPLMMVGVICMPPRRRCADLLSDSLQMLLFCISESQERDKETVSLCN